MSNLSENERKYVEDRREALKEATKRLDKSKSNLIAARADAAMYRALERGIEKSIETSFGSGGEYFPINENSKIFRYWRDDLLHVIAKLYEAEEYLSECVEDMDNAIEEKEEAVKAFEVAFNGAPEYHLIPEYPRGGNF